MRSTFSRGAVRRALAATLVAGAVGAVAVVGASSSFAGAGTPSTTIAQAKAFVKSIEKRPTSIEITQPLKKTPPKGKTIVFLVCQVPQCQSFKYGLDPAAKLLGWHMKYITYTATAASENGAFQAALALHPAGIASTGLLRATIAAPYKTAQQEHIPIVTGYAVDAPAPPVIANVFDNTHSDAPNPKALADYIAVNSNCKADVLAFNINIYPILNFATATFQKDLASVCPSAKLKIVDVGVTALGTTLPASVVSAFQADPKVNYLAFAFGDMADGVEPALKAAGLSAPILGYGTAGPENLTAITQGQEDVMAADSLPYGGWRMIDAFARYYTGTPYTIDTTAPNTLELFTHANAFATTQWSFSDPPNMAGQFAKLWHVKG